MYIHKCAQFTYTHIYIIYIACYRLKPANQTKTLTAKPRASSTVIQVHVTCFFSLLFNFLSLSLYLSMSRAFSLSPPLPLFVTFRATTHETARTYTNKHSYFYSSSFSSSFPSIYSPSLSSSS